MTATASAVVTIVPEVDMTAFRAAFAEGLRKLADDVEGLPVPGDAVPAKPAPKPERYVAVRDKDGDLGVLDNESQRHIPGLSASETVEALGDLRVGRGWHPTLDARSWVDVPAETYAPLGEVSL